MKNFSTNSFVVVLASTTFDEKDYIRDHNDFIHLDNFKKIEINPEIFKTDIKKLKIHCQLFLSQILTIGFKQYFELDYDIIKNSLKPELKESIDAKDKINKILKDFEFVLSDFKK